MSRELRTLLILAVLSVVGLVGLFLLAHRYARILQERAPLAQGSGAGSPRHGATTRDDATNAPDVGAVVDALRDVDAFIVVQRGLRRRLGPDPGGLSAERVREARDRALREAGISRARYEGVKRRYEDWRAGKRAPGGPFESAFELRSAQLAQLAPTDLS